MKQFSISLSVVLATHNEEKNIAQCLNSIKDIADEIIVVDGQSQDNTVAIARQFGAQIISTTNKANFHINKQLAMNKAVGKYVLQLDADEVVDQELKSFIQALKQNSSPPAEAWWLRRKNMFLGHWLTKGGQYPDPVIRLYVNGKARLPQKDVHEQMEVDGVCATASGHLIHYGNPTFEIYLKKWNTYTSFSAEQYKSKNMPLSIWKAIEYLAYKPIVTFIQLYLRHKGFVDGVPGFVFALMSGTHHAVAYLKYWETLNREKI